jgi:hypothetical protein
MADASLERAGGAMRRLALATIREAIDAVRQDLLAGAAAAELTGRLPGLGIEARLVDSGAADVVSSLAGGETYLFRVSTSSDLATLTCHLADRLQDFVVENLRRAAPRCPSHPHPLEPDVVAERAVWRCPAVPQWTCPIGEYHAYLDTHQPDCDRQRDPAAPRWHRR